MSLGHLHVKSLILQKKVSKTPPENPKNITRNDRGKTRIHPNTNTQTPTLERSRVLLRNEPESGMLTSDSRIPHHSPHFSLPIYHQNETRLPGGDGNSSTSQFSIDAAVVDVLYK